LVGRLFFVYVTEVLPTCCLVRDHPGSHRVSRLHDRDRILGQKASKWQDRRITPAQTFVLIHIERSNRMKSKVAIAGSVILLFGLVFWLPGSGEAQTINLTFSDIYPATHANSKNAAAWCKEVEKRTGGKVKITFYPGQSLTKGAECYEGVVSGLSDLGQSVLQYTRGRFPLTDFINLPLGYPSGAFATAIINEFYDKFKPAELQTTKVMYLHAHGPGFIHTKDKPVEKMEDLKGLKIRSHGPTAEMIKCLGGTPVTFPMPELYQALQKGVVNGGIFPMESEKGWKLAEVTNYTTACYPTAYSLGFFVVMNKDKWNSLPDDVKKTIEKINVEWARKQGQIWDEADSEGIRFFLSSGGRMLGIDKKEAERWVKAVQPVSATYLKETKQKGLPGEEVLTFVRKGLDEYAKGTFKSKYLSED
jgi:TRAP-type C4-dicarboxylate transport system substrate-binding protein